ncbi:MAG: TIGR02757 family protein [Flavobacteriaceae bacterium]|nr:TIGR02757 family protein [Flavobacteriaceae bacterium]MCY4215419.1 TIGR02757 family protein [Flavobacteriaceae bacterium]MCY4253902.1 TIGR02757 family protein [Flavobacteriaceae bacterium]
MVKLSDDQKRLKDFLDQKAHLYESEEFIDSDPIQIPHRFSLKEDIEIIGFLITTIAWGNRKSIINSGFKMLELFEKNPYDFIINHSSKDLSRFQYFAHRTFQRDDMLYFIKALHGIYKEKGGLQPLFSFNRSMENLYKTIHDFKKEFFMWPHLKRTRKHISDPFNGSASKRINLFLRWMVRSSKRKVDFGIWKDIPSSILSCPLDIHTHQVALKLGLITKRTPDFKTLVELDANLRKFDSVDPVKYDFALFGLGVFENF